jgi:hypothetical protein
MAELIDIDGDGVVDEEEYKLFRKIQVRSRGGV